LVSSFGIAHNGEQTGFILAWLVIQIGDTLGLALLLPNWIISVPAYFPILGFPLIAGNKKMKTR